MKTIEEIKGIKGSVCVSRRGVLNDKRNNKRIQ